MAAILWLSLWLDKLLISCSMYSLLVRKQEPLIEFFVFTISLQHLIANYINLWYSLVFRLFFLDITKQNELCYDKQDFNKCGDWICQSIWSFLSQIMYRTASWTLLATTETTPKMANHSLVRLHAHKCSFGKVCPLQ